MFSYIIFIRFVLGSMHFHDIRSNRFEDFHRSIAELLTESDQGREREPAKSRKMNCNGTSLAEIINYFIAFQT